MALGYDRIDLLSESAGTRTAMIYSWRYPESIHRSVMIGVNPPGNFLWDAKTTDEQIGRYADLCSKDEACSKRTDDLAASMRRTAADIPDRWWFLPIKEGNVRVASFFGLMETTSEAAPLSAPMTLNSWLSAADGDASGLWFMSLLRRLRLPRGVRLGRVRRHREGRRPGRERLLLLRWAGARFDPRRCRDCVRLGWRPAGRCLAGRAGRGRVQPCADVEHRDAPHRRGARLLDPAAGRDEGAPPLSAERPPGRAGRFRAHDHLLDGPAGSRHPADQHLLRQRPGRRLALHACERRLHARGHTDGARQGHRGRDGRPRAHHGPLAAAGCLAGCTSEDASDARPARPCGRCTRSCSAWADGSSVP